MKAKFLLAGALVGTWAAVLGVSPAMAQPIVIGVCAPSPFCFPSSRNSRLRLVGPLIVIAGMPLFESIAHKEIPSPLK